MKRWQIVVLGLLLAGSAIPGSAAAGRPLAVPAVAPDVAFSPPINASQTGNLHTPVLTTGADGTVTVSYPDSANATISVASNAVFNGRFTQDDFDSSPRLVGSLRSVSDARHRQHVVWFHNLNNGDTIIYYARKDPGSAGTTWHVGPIPGSETGADTNGAYKVLGIAYGQNDRVYVLWARNGVGARLSWTDDGTNWAPYETVPARFPSDATDINLGATTTGHVFVGWFQRSPNDIFVQERQPNGTWGPVTDVSARPVKDQDLTPRFATAPDGGLRLVWTGYSSPSATSADGFYRAWTPAGGWSPTIVQLWRTPGNGNSRGVEVAVDPGGVAHIVWDDDTGRDANNVTTYYIRGQGTTFTPPQQVVPQFGQATARYPYVDVGPAPDGQEKVHVAVNANVGGPFGDGTFDNYYLWTNAGAAPVPPTATPCSAGQFADVPAASPYYPWISDLARRGTISGYGDCTFRPGNPITRSQAAKVLVLAFGFTLLTPVSGHFSDVPPGTPFYPYVETAFAHGIISGYAGGTFRPNASVTRGQLAKMVALGKGWPLLNPAQATFTDVPPGSAFYPYVETAVSRGVISGYSCGPNCRVFRVAESGNRGQTAKIVDIAVAAGQGTGTPTATAVLRTPTPQPPTATRTLVPPRATPTRTPGRAPAP